LQSYKVKAIPVRRRQYHGYGGSLSKKCKKNRFGQGGQ
jgi:hypothetical protein